MCVYCVCSSTFQKYLPAPPDWYRTYPNVMQLPFTTPIVSIEPKPWTREQLNEINEVLRRIKELESKSDCPCDDYDPTKIEFLEYIKNKLDELEKKEKVS